MFPSSAGTLHVPNNARKTWRKIREEASFGWVTVHTFRRTITMLADAEADLRSASEQLGHAGQDITQRLYVQKTHQGPAVRAVFDTFVTRSTS